VTRAARLVCAALPGVALAVVGLAGFSSDAGDLPDYFAPLRMRTVAVLRGMRGPFWNPDSGCGEPFFANPQSALLYPPAWLGAAGDPAAALLLEAGVHLALLGVGAAFLARRLGASAASEVAVAWVITLAGPTIDAVGVLNNLDALAWVPWAWAAAMAGSLAGIAASLSLCFLAGEPHIALIAGVGVLVLLPRRTGVAGAVLAAGLVAVQAGPFLAWVAVGQRDTAGGGLRLLQLVGTALPGVAPPLPGDFLKHPDLALVALVLGVAATWRAHGAGRRLAVLGWSLLAAAFLSGLPIGSSLWRTLTGGLASYPARLVFPALLAIVSAGLSAPPVRLFGAWVATGVVVATVAATTVLGGKPWLALAQGVSTATALCGVAVAPAAIAGALLAAPDRVRQLELGRTSTGAATPCIAAATTGHPRIWSVQPSRHQLRWVAGSASRRRALGLGYSALLDGRRMARSFAPVELRAVARHLDEADRGTVGRWWLDSTGSSLLLSHHPIDGFPLVCAAEGLWLYGNPSAWPEQAVVRRIPVVGEEPARCGEVLSIAGDDERREWNVHADDGGGVLVWLTAPDPGWQFTVDGVLAVPVPGPGIVHGVWVPGGEHVIRAWYRPPLGAVGALVSLVSIGVLGVAAWRRW
jgi:hypothetical protein